MYCHYSSLDTPEQEKEIKEAIGSMALNSRTTLENVSAHRGSLREDRADCKSDPQSLPLDEENFLGRKIRRETESPSKDVAFLCFSGARSAFACLPPDQGQKCRETNIKVDSTETTSLDDIGAQEASSTRTFNRLASLHPCLVCECKKAICRSDPAMIISPAVTGFTGASCADETTSSSQDCKSLIPEQLEGGKIVMREERSACTSKNSVKSLNSMEASYVVRDTSIPSREVCMTENWGGRWNLSIKNLQKTKDSTEASSTGGGLSSPCELKSLTPGQHEGCRTEIAEGKETQTSRTVQDAISTSRYFCIDRTISSSPDSRSLAPSKHEAGEGREASTSRAALESIGSFEASCIGRGPSISSDCTSLPPGQREALRTEISEGTGALTCSPNRIEAVSFSRSPSIPNDLTFLNPSQSEVWRNEISEKQFSLTSWPSFQTGSGRFDGHLSPSTSVCSESLLASFQIHRAHKRHLEQAKDQGDARKSHISKKTMVTLPSLQGEAVQEKRHYTSSHRTGQWSALPLNSPRPSCAASGVAGCREVHLCPLAPGHPALVEAPPQRSAPRNLELLLLKFSKGDMQVHHDQTPFRYTYPTPSRVLQDTALGIRCPRAMSRWAFQYLNTSGADTERQSPPRKS
ncbi:uncharacterized protein [Pleurodeles waltl]